MDTFHPFIAVFYLTINFVLCKTLFIAANTSIMRHEESAFGFARFVEFANKALMMKPFKEIHTQNYKLCLMGCLADNRCASLNFQTKPTSDGLFLCELLETDLLRNGDKLEENMDFIHFMLRSECLFSPCLNEGTCITDYTDWSYSCECKDTGCFIGKNCEIGYYPLGMEDGRITDSQITASSYYSTFRPEKARLRHNNAWLSWVAKRNRAGEFLQIDLLKEKPICKIATESRVSRMVTEYTLDYSNNGTTWMTYGQNSNSTGQVFQGNTRWTVVECNFLNPPLVSRYVRIVVQKWSIYIAMRTELYSCYE